MHHWRRSAWFDLEGNLVTRGSSFSIEEAEQDHYKSGYCERCFLFINNRETSQGWLGIQCRPR